MPLRGATTEPKVPIVVIDAGHGGKDPGAVRGSVHEKTINLAVALELGRQLEKLMPRVKIVYTRSDDTFVELGERTTIANEAEADLFVSIHTNSNPNSRIAGTETYVMGADKNSANLAVSMRENGVISLEADYHTRYEGYDPKSSESLIIFSLMQYAYQSQSLALARGVETAYKGVWPRAGCVKQVFWCFGVQRCPAF
ncbi:MAG: N-acetylmuramoyl-L-alanine amidase [Mucinivorans sp.]